MFVLDFCQQSGVSLVPKWESLSCMGVNLGFSLVHFSNMVLISNPTTCFVYMQYHLVFDEDFSTLEYVRNMKELPHWSVLVRQSSSLLTDSPVPVDSDLWLVFFGHHDHAPCIPSSTVSAPSSALTTLVTSSCVAEPTDPQLLSSDPAYLMLDPSHPVADVPSPPVNVLSSSVPLPSSSSPLWVRFCERDDFVLPTAPMLLAKGDPVEASGFETPALASKGVSSDQASTKGSADPWALLPCCLAYITQHWSARETRTCLVAQMHHCLECQPLSILTPLVCIGLIVPHVCVS